MTYIIISKDVVPYSCSGQTGVEYSESAGDRTTCREVSTSFSMYGRDDHIAGCHCTDDRLMSHEGICVPMELCHCYDEQTQTYFSAESVTTQACSNWSVQRHVNLEQVRFIMVTSRLNRERDMGCLPFLK